MILVVAAVVGAAVGFVAPRWQHLLYREAEFREDRARGGRLRSLRLLTVPTGAASCAIAFRPDHYDAGPAAFTALFALALIVLSSADFERRRLPDRIMLPAIALAVSAGWVWPDRSWGAVLGGFGFAVGVAIALFALGAAVGMLLKVKATPFGLGDVKLIVLVGALCGWPAVMNALFFGVLAAGIPSFMMIASGRGRLVFSYGPYLAAGCLVVLLVPRPFV